MSSIDLRGINKKTPQKTERKILANLLRRRKGPNRDEAGKFSARQAGLRFPKGFKWKRSLPIVIVVALTGGYLVFQSFAAGVRPQGVYSNWSWDTPSGGFTNLSHELTIEEVTPDAPYFWSNQFNFVGGDGGYIGLQSRGSRVDGTVGKTAVFSVFNSGIQGTTGCSVEQGNFDGASGSGTSCRVAYDWQVGVKYKFRVEKGTVESNGTWWSGYITNTATGTETLIAKYKVLPSWQGLGDWSVQWTEYFGQLPATCNDLARSKVRFYKPTRTYNGQNVLPARSWLHYATGADCTNSRVVEFNGGTIQEMGPAENVTPKTGLQATYYTGPTLKGNFVSRIDPNINFTWNDSTAPVGGIGTNFSARWTGKLVAPATGSYTINMSANDTATMWLDGKPFLDTRGLSPGSGKTGQILLEAGKEYPFEFDLYDISGPAVAYLSWKVPGSSGTVTIPQTAFKPTKQAGLSARYSNRGAVVKYYALKNEPKIDNSWGTATPGSGVPADGFRVNWFGKLKVPTSGTYKFISVSNDGVQLVINNSMLINDWTNGPTRRREKSIKLEAGKEYAISFNYYDNTGEATSRLLWSGPGIAETPIPSSAFTTN